MLDETLCSNHSMTRIQSGKIETRTNTKISDIYNLLIRNKMECYKEQYIKKEDKE